MEIKGKLVQLLPLQTGMGKNGEWKKQDIILETEGEYPKQVCISLWGDKINSQLQQEDVVRASVSLESREFNGKWYTDVKAWKLDIEKKQEVSGNLPMDTKSSANERNISSKENPFNTMVEDDGLPF
jgi:hypothetical protein